MEDVLKVAEYLLQRGYDEGELITHKKLECLLYFCQCFHLLASGGERLFKEPITKWHNGTYIHKIEEKFEAMHNEPLNARLGLFFGTGKYDFSPDEKQSIDEAYDYKIPCGSAELIQEIINSEPWEKTELCHDIDIKLLYEYLKKEDDERKRLIAEIEQIEQYTSEDSDEAKD